MLMITMMIVKTRTIFKLIIIEIVKTTMIKTTRTAETKSLTTQMAGVVTVQHIFHQKLG